MTLFVWDTLKFVEDQKVPIVDGVHDLDALELWLDVSYNIVNIILQNSLICKRNNERNSAHPGNWLMVKPEDIR